MPSRTQYPLPLIPELLEHLQGACWFTKGAYNLICVHQGNEWKTAFVCTYGHFEYRVIPFGLCNAPATFQGFVNDVFYDLLDNYVIAHLDDILVYSRMWEEDDVHIREVLSHLWSHCLYAKLEKYAFLQQRIDFLGYSIAPEGVSMDMKKIDAFLCWQSPLMACGVCSAFGILLGILLKRLLRSQH